MKRLASILFFGLFSIIGFSQETPATQETTTSQEDSTNQEVSTIQEDSTSQEATGSKKASAKKKSNFFISTNSGLQKTPIGFRIGAFERSGGYLGVRFGKGDIPVHDHEATQATLISLTGGVIFPVFAKKTDFRIHAFTGAGFGQWLDRPLNEQGVSLELEGGIMISYKKVMFSFGGNMLTGGGTPTDVTLGLGYKL